MINKIVLEVMSFNFIIVKLKMFLKEVIKILVEKYISGFFVVDDNGKLVGIVLEIDLMW